MSLKCLKHPPECMATDDDGNEICEWCEQILTMRLERDRVAEQIGKLAVIIKSGEVVISCNEIGYMDIRGGNVKFHHCAPKDHKEVAT